MKLLEKLPRFFASVIVTAAVLYLTLFPKPLVSMRIPLFDGADKVVHFLMFFAMAVAYYLDFKRVGRPVGSLRLSGWIFIALSAMGGLIELAQWQMHMGRSGDWFDLLADVVGAFYGLLLVWLLTNKK